MSYKFNRFKENITKYLIVFGVLWLILTIVLVVPLSVLLGDIEKQDTNATMYIVENFSSEMFNFSNIGKIFQEPYSGNFKSIFGYGSILYVLFVVVMFSKIGPKHEYTNIEHGSSGWSENGEQYRILSKNNGIILAEKNCLPLDKRGNINVLVVGRIWIW